MLHDSEVFLCSFLESKVFPPHRLAKDKAQPLVAQCFLSNFWKMKSLLAVFQWVVSIQNHLFLEKHHLKRWLKEGFGEGVFRFFLKKTDLMQPAFRGAVLFKQSGWKQLSGPTHRGNLCPGVAPVGTIDAKNGGEIRPKLLGIFAIWKNYSHAKHW